MHEPATRRELLPDLLNARRERLRVAGGRRLIPGTTNTFGGTSTAEYGPIYALVYADFPGDPGTAPFLENFRNIMSTNPCPSTGQFPS
jgi:hypothetical protein